WIERQYPAPATAQQQSPPRCRASLRGDTRRTFSVQPYQQLAKVLGETGDSDGRRDVLIAMEDARSQHGKYGVIESARRWILKCTIRYGYQPFYAFRFIVAFVVFGTALFAMGNAVGVMVLVDDKQP